MPSMDCEAPQTWATGVVISCVGSQLPLVKQWSQPGRVGSLQSLVTSTFADFRGRRDRKDGRAAVKGSRVGIDAVSTMKMEEPAIRNELWRIVISL